MDEEDNEEIIIESLAKTRSRRSNAGANMSKLLDKEEEDDFYKTQYGGFSEIEDDRDFSASDSSDSENVIDSDFDLDENLDQQEDDEEQEEKQLQKEEKLERQKEQKRKTVYREVLNKKSSSSTTTTFESKINNAAEGIIKKEDDGDEQTTPAIKKPKKVSNQGTTSFKSKNNLLISDKDPIHKNLRESTKKVSRETKENLEDERRRKLKGEHRKKRKYYRQLTLEERLQEAKKTEQENMRSLLAYKNLEIEKSKRNTIVRKIPNVPLISYHSYKEDITDKESKNGEKLTNFRTIITFPNEELFNKYFEKYKKPILEPQKRRIAALSNLPVKYIDPLTKFPFATVSEFSLIRRAYNNYLKQISEQDELIKKFIDTASPVQKIKITNKKITTLTTATITSGGGGTNDGDDTNNKNMILTNEHLTSTQYPILKKKNENKPVILVVSSGPGPSKSGVDNPSTSSSSSLSSSSTTTSDQKQSNEIKSKTIITTQPIVVVSTSQSQQLQQQQQQSTPSTSKSSSSTSTTIDTNLDIKTTPPVVTNELKTTNES